MSDTCNSLQTSFIQRIRLMVGDINEFPLLEDNVYNWLYLQNERNELATAIEAVENIITMLVLNPNDESVGGVGQKTPSLSDYQQVLKNLKMRKNRDKQKVSRVPMLIRSDRTSWSDIDTIFGKE